MCSAPDDNMPAKLNPFYVDTFPDVMLVRLMAQARAGKFQCFYRTHAERLRDATLPFANDATAIRATNRPRP